ncbi:MAG: CRISPR-associated endonuclease Cas2 [Planctomycetota bacterium]|jgi:CRISPR-associated protein Cas2|nr:CRISPR-associated endonuclease Cas2 [Planctomycetota bacterium]
MRFLYIVTYDICEDTRLRRVFKLMKGYGDHLQYSVFRCELNDRERIELMARLTDEIKNDEDQILFFPLGPVGTQREDRILSLGLPYSPASLAAIVI